MPYSNPAPLFVLPKNRLGYEDAKRMKLDPAHVTFCEDYSQERGEGSKCRNRSLLGDRRYNWCTRCLAGHAILKPEEWDGDMEQWTPDPIRLNFI